MLCSLMLLLLLNRWAGATISSLSASELALLSPSKALYGSVKEKRSISQLSAQACLVLDLALSVLSSCHLHWYKSL